MTIIGHKRIRESLVKAAKQGNVGHAYLFSGPEGVGKMTVALEFSKILQHTEYANFDSNLIRIRCEYTDGCDCKICEDIDKGAHPDVIVLSPQEDSREIKIEQIRQLRKSLQLSSYSAPYKIAVIDYAEKMNQEAANAFLKTLEEPHDKTVLIIITKDSRALLPTIVSRCQIVNFLPLGIQEIENFLSRTYAEKNADLRGNYPRPSALSSASIRIEEIARLSCGCPGKALKITNNQSELKELRAELAKFLESDLTAKFKYIESVCKDDAKISRLLGDWLIISRDILLFDYNCQDLIINKSQNNFLAAIANRYPLKNLIRVIGAIRRIKFLIENTNINARLALENLVLETYY